MEWVFGFNTAAPGLGLALLAGLVNSLSPCCLAMTPAFLAHLAGVEVESSTRRKRFTHAGLYVLGFSLVFIVLGAGLGIAGVALQDHRQLLFRVGGTVVIAFGLVQLGVLRIPLLDRSFEVRIAADGQVGYARSMIVGATYSIAWTPCIGPVLGAIITGAVVFGDVWWSIALLSSFAVGMAIPHVAAVLAFERISGLRKFLARHTRAVETTSGVVMVAMGILIFTGALIEIFRYFQGFTVVL